jgi:UDP-N-acetylglucosamine diphosphorylase / glucose-1-phosphate thymidylyltransferase / UDP-N-acetylgalactosamine diphosphorylase / glucosamine-1-phosphate N-acetyltransferase / galactosamine-1-phosphate N-acetyltransferase
MLAPMFKPDDLFDLKQTQHADLFAGCEYAWDALKKLKEYLLAHLHPELLNRCEGTAYIGEQVYIGEGTVVEDGAMIRGPAIIGRNCRIRHNAYIREDVIIGDDCMIGNACEIKHSLVFNEAEIPHFNYVGDSILGYQAHLGAGVKVSNLKITPGHVAVEIDGKPFDTGLRKFGVLMGDCSEVGCNAVLNPGSIIGRGALVYPCTNWRGILPPHSIAKNRAAIEVVMREARSA